MKALKGIQLNKDQFYKFGLLLTPGTTLGEWRELTSKISTVGTAYLWWIGDLAAFASRNFSESEYQECVKTLCDTCMISRSRMDAIRLTCESYKMSERSEKASFTHHLYAKNLPKAERKKLIASVAEKKLSVAETWEESKPKSERRIRVMLNIPASAIKFMINGKVVLETRLNSFVSDFNGKWYFFGRAYKKEAR